MHMSNYKTSRRNQKRYQTMTRKSNHVTIPRIVMYFMYFIFALSIVLDFSIIYTVKTQIMPLIDESINSMNSITAMYKQNIIEATQDNDSNEIMTLSEEIEEDKETESNEDDEIVKMEEIIIPEKVEEIEPPKPTLEEQLGNNNITIENTTLKKYDLPDKYYPGIDFSSFQPYMGYKCITNKNSGAYKISHSENAYTDELGLRRYKTNDSQFTINGQDDYMIALGTYYKPKGKVGNRYLIVTTTGMYTAITGDEKANAHTDSKHMFSRHGNKAGVIEWIVDSQKLNSVSKRAGTVTQGGPKATQGKILYIYGIE